MLVMLIIAAEVTTLWRYTDVCIIIIVILPVIIIIIIIITHIIAYH